MFGGITFTPSVPLHAAGAFARHHIGVSTTNSCIFDRFVGINGCMITGGSLHHLAVMAYIELSMMAVTARQSSGITGLHAVHSQVCIPFVSIVQLAFVIKDIATRFVVTDYFNPFLLGITCHLCHIEIDIRLGIVKSLHTAPTFPAFIPALEHHRFYVIGSSKIYISFGISGGSAVAFIHRPRFNPQMHSPPDTYVFHRTYPAQITLQRTRFIQIQYQAGVYQTYRFGSYLNTAPRSHESPSGKTGFHPIGPGSQFRFEVTTFGMLQSHFGEIGQSCFVDTGIYPVICFESHRGIGIIHLADGQGTIQQLVGFKTGGNRP